MWWIVCLVSLEYILGGGLLMAHAEAGRHCTVQSITYPKAGRSGLVHLVDYLVLSCFFRVHPLGGLFL